MPSSVGLQDVLWYAGLALKAALLARLFSLRLAGQYRALVFCLAVHLVRTLSLMPLSVRSDAYALTYMLSEPVLLATYVLAALEIYTQVFVSYQSLSRLGRRTLLITLGLSALLSGLFHWARLDFSAEPYRWLRVIFLLESSVCGMLLVFLLALALFPLWFPIRLRRNLLLYNFGFSVFFLAMSMGVFLRNANPAWAHTASTIRLAVYDACLLGWALLFSRAGESAALQAAPAFRRGEEQRLLSQLDAMNRALQSSRKSF